MKKRLILFVLCVLVIEDVALGAKEVTKVPAKKFVKKSYKKKPPKPKPLTKEETLSLIQKQYNQENFRAVVKLGLPLTMNKSSESLDEYDELLEKVAISLSKISQDKKAVQLYSKLLDRGALKDLRLISRASDSALKSASYQSGLSFTVLYNQFKTDARNLNYMGLFFFYLKNYEYALFAFNSSLILNQDPEVLCNLAKTYLKMGKQGEAITYYKNAYDMEPNNQNAYQALVALKVIVPKKTKISKPPIDSELSEAKQVSLEPQS